MLWRHTQIMGSHQQLRGIVAENPNQVKGIAVHWRGLCLKIMELLQQRWQQNSIFIVKTLFPPKTVRRELHRSNIHGKAETAKPLITENNDKRWKRWCDDHETWKSDDWKYIVRSHESSMLFPASGRVCVRRTPKKTYNPECLVPSVKHGARSVTIWAAISRYGARSVTIWAAISRYGARSVTI